MGVTELSQWLREQLVAAGARGFVYGLSGGIDSAVVGALCRIAAPDKTLGIIMPCNSSPTDERDANAIAETLGLSTLRIALEPAFEALIESANFAFAAHFACRPPSRTDCKARLPVANVKPRLRMTTLYLAANRLNYLVVGTGNRSEIAIGYYTKYGDGGVDLLPIGRMLKREVIELARDLSIPDAVIDKAPSAGLWQGQTDESEMGFSYDELEQFLVTGADSVPGDVALRIQQLVATSAHKRALPPMPPE